MLNIDDAIDFLQKHLNIDYGTFNPENKLPFLNNIIHQYHQTVPFQNLGLLSKKPEDRHKPSLDEVKHCILNGTGGLCYINNVFVGYLLRALGYRAEFSVSSVACPNNHLIILVRDVVKNGDIYFVETGCGYPTFQAIPMDFEKESPMYKDSFLEYKFIKKDGRIWRMHKRGDLRPGGPLVPQQDLLDGCRRFYDFALETEPLKFYDDFMEVVFSNPEMSPFHKSLRIMCFPQGEATGFKDTTLLEEDSDNNKLIGKEMVDFDRLKISIKLKYPQFSNIVDKAISNWKQIYKNN